VSGSKIATGAAWMMGARLADRFAGLISTTILARLLVPADFGLVAMAMAVISLIDLANSFGFEIPLIRATNPSREMYDSVWTLNILFGLFCSVTIIVAAFPAAAFYGDSRLLAVMGWLAAGWLAGSFANVGIVDFRREMNFAKEFQILLASRVTTFAVTIPCALYFRSYWALIAGMVAGRFVSTLVSYLWHPFRPRFSLRSSKELFNFSQWIFIEKIASFGNARAADFLLGRVHGPTALGTFRMADEIGSLPGTELIAPINRALLPGAFKMAESGRDFAEITLKATGVVAILLVPACLGIAVIAEPLVLAMLGPKWLSAVPILRVLALAAVLAAFWGNQSTLLFAGGWPRLPGVVAILRLVLFVPLVLLWVPKMSGLGLSWAILLSSALAYSYGLFQSLLRLRVSLAQYLTVIWRPIASSILMYVVVHQLLRYLARPDFAFHVLVQLLVGVACGALVYVLGMFLLYRMLGPGLGAEQIMLDRVSGAWKARRSGEGK
jgi:lipopolysaccharide exporter